MKRSINWNPLQPDLFDAWDEPKLLSVCMELGASSVKGWSKTEDRLTRALPLVDTDVVSSINDAIQLGQDPLGDLICSLRTAATRRSLGATYTPLPIVRAMVSSAKEVGTPSRVVDPGCGSARFLVAAGRSFSDAELIGFDVDPVATILGRAHLSASGLEARSCLSLHDYRLAPLPPSNGRTLFLGNPPYIRHHLLPPEWKEWLVSSAGKLGYKASQLAGLHVYFFLATVLKGRSGDFGSFITASEWLEVNYGSLVRDLFLGGLGGTSITVIEPTALPFPDASTTGAVTNFQIGTKPEKVSLARIEDIGHLAAPEVVRHVKRERLENEKRWSHLTRGTKNIPNDFVELGELCRVHRGCVTGANKVWIAGEHSDALPTSVLYRTVTRAKELIAAGLELRDSTNLRYVIDLPEDLDSLDPEDRKLVDHFLKIARSVGAHDGYIARARKAWWSVGLKSPAPVLATYMARKPPSFVRNTAEARHINVAHGLYPRQPIEEPILEGLVRFLSSFISVNDGRTYAGGLTKFEPREMERLLVPRPEHILNFI